jgi:hypothetical protein
MKLDRCRRLSHSTFYGFSVYYRFPNPWVCPLEEHIRRSVHRSRCIHHWYRHNGGGGSRHSMHFWSIRGFLTKGSTESLSSRGTHSPLGTYSQSPVQAHRRRMHSTFHGFSVYPSSFLSDANLGLETVKCRSRLLIRSSPRPCSEIRLL